MFNFKILSGVSDKLLHFIGGIIIACTVLVITKEPWYGFGAALLIGGYKEFFDHRKVASISPEYVKHTYLDWALTILGGLLVELIF